ncbi:MAG: CPBP family intramembrane metalloprotease [Alphaproteobacteria bacterium]|nr:MAG: CPBP family intramembrane metalloprotease [Alphaproteobacteria bacterium]
MENGLFLHNAAASPFSKGNGQRDSRGIPKGMVQWEWPVSSAHAIRDRHREVIGQMNNERPAQGRDLFRGTIAALFLIGAYFAFDPIETAIHAPIAKALGLHMIAHGEMGLLPYGVLMLVRFALDLLVVAGVLAILRRPWPGFPLTGPRSTWLTLVGLAIGLLVMTGAILAIIGGGSATVTTPAHTAASATVYGTGWLAFDYLGAAGEELYGRVAVLLVAQSLIGWRGAILVSGLMFSVLHLGNPGADWVWLLRLFVQGMLLAYAVYRTGSVWWSIGYHSRRQRLPRSRPPA